MKKKTFLLLPLATLLLAGCAERTTTITIQSISEKQYQQEQAVKTSARTMYRMILRQDAKGFCRFVAPASIASLPTQLPSSDLSPQQACQVLSKAAFQAYLEQPGGRQALQESIRMIARSPVKIQGKQAWIGNGQHYTKFQKIGARWRPAMPRLGARTSPSQPDGTVESAPQYQVAV